MAKSKPKTKSKAKSKKRSKAVKVITLPTAHTQRGKGPLVSILTEAPEHLPVVIGARTVLDGLGISNDVRVLSAHRTPLETVEYVKSAEDAGVEVFVCCAGMAAHLAGVVASNTTRPVIGVPLASGALDGMDALLSTVQMPPGIPVATVAVDSAENAGYLAARIVAATRPVIRAAIESDLAEARASGFDSPKVGSKTRADALQPSRPVSFAVRAAPTPEDTPAKKAAAKGNPAKKAPEKAATKKAPKKAAAKNTSAKKAPKKAAAKGTAAKKAPKKSAPAKKAPKKATRAGKTAVAKTTRARASKAPAARPSAEKTSD